MTHMVVLCFGDGYTLLERVERYCLRTAQPAHIWIPIKFFIEPIEDEC